MSLWSSMLIVPTCRYLVLSVVANQLLMPHPLTVVHYLGPYACRAMHVLEGTEKLWSLYWYCFCSFCSSSILSLVSTSLMVVTLALFTIISTLATMFFILLMVAFSFPVCFSKYLFSVFQVLWTPCFPAGAVFSAASAAAESVSFGILLSGLDSLCPEGPYMSLSSLIAAAAVSVTLEAELAAAPPFYETVGCVSALAEARSLKVLFRQHRHVFAFAGARKVSPNPWAMCPCF